MPHIQRALLLSVLAISPAVLCQQPSQVPPPRLREVQVQNPHRATQESGKDATKAQQGTKDSPVFVEQVSAPKTEAETAKDKEREETKTRDEWINMGLTGALVVASFLQVLGIIFQARILRRQTKVLDKQANIMNSSLLAAEKAAEAARNSVDTYVATERPFIMIETRGKGVVEFWAVNYGKSPRI
jgi:hypothetical protein